LGKLKTFIAMHAELIAIIAIAAAVIALLAYSIAGIY